MHRLHHACLFVSACGAVTLQQCSDTLLNSSAPAFPCCYFFMSVDTCSLTLASQMKARYSTRRPYGEWLQQAVSLKDIVDSVPEAERQPQLLGLSAVAPSNNGTGNGNGAHAAAAATASAVTANGSSNGNGSNGKGALGTVSNTEEDSLVKILQPLKAFG